MMATFRNFSKEVKVLIAVLCAIAFTIVGGIIGDHFWSHPWLGRFAGLLLYAVCHLSLEIMIHPTDTWKHPSHTHLK